MRYITFTEEQDSYDVAILIKDKYFHEDNLKREYLRRLDIPKEKIIAFNLKYVNDKASNTTIKQYLNDLLPELKELGIKYIYCADAAYFKVLAKKTKADPHVGYLYNLPFKGYEHIQVTYGVSYGQVLYNIQQLDKMDLSLQTLSDAYNQQYKAIGQEIQIYDDCLYELPSTSVLNRLLNQPLLVVDIETSGLDVEKDVIVSIAFAWSKQQGYAFNISHAQDTHTHFDFLISLKHFFERYQGTLVFHNAGFDIKFLIRKLWMTSANDTNSLLFGLNTLFRSVHDTMIIAYLAVNSAYGNKLSLKDLAQPYLGDWALTEIKDIHQASLRNVLKYNLLDCLGTFYVFEEYMPKMIADKQDKLYYELMLPTLKVLTQIELTGMPLDPNQVIKAEKVLNDLSDEANRILFGSDDVIQATALIREYAAEKANQKLKKLRKTADDFAHLEFNPNSSQHVAILLHEVMDLPILEYTATKQPSTSTSTLEKLLNHANDNQKVVLEKLIELSGISKILSAFIPTFKEAGTVLRGSFHIGGTISGRLSSSNPNLQQTPSGSTYGKLIKECFKAPKGWLFCGADYQALEDKINTLLTKDPNKIKVWTDGYDAHCFRSYYYFGDQMPDIEDTVESINSIKQKYPELRSKSKAPSFALQYAGTWITLMKSCGFSEEEAKRIEANYHRMYQVSDEWMAQRLKECCEHGYATVAFGLRIRTPLLKHTVLGTAKTPKEAEAEARSVGNALSGQSYGLLNNRAVVEFMNRVWQSKYRLHIKPVALIHDAIYILVKNDVDIVKWANDNLIECMSWNELPEIQHPEIKLSAELDVFYPDWAHPVTIPNNASVSEIKELCRKHLESL